MPNPGLNLDVLKLDPDLERQLSSHLDRQIQLGNFDLSHDRVFVVDGGSGSDLFSKLKRTLDPYVDFDAGGLKVLSMHYRGSDARFTVVPGWQPGPADAHGKASLGGPTIALKFTLTW